MKFHVGIQNSSGVNHQLISPLEGKNPLKLEQFIDDGEASEIILERVLEFCPVEQIHSYLTLVSKKLAHGGKLTIVSNDIVMLTEAFLRQEVNIIDFNRILFGSKDHAWNFKLSTVCLADVNDILKSFGLKVLERRLNGWEFVISAERQ